MDVVRSAVRVITQAAVIGSTVVDCAAAVVLRWTGSEHTVQARRLDAGPPHAAYLLRTQYEAVRAGETRAR
jgi:hypothetical protein